MDIRCWNDYVRLERTFPRVGIIIPNKLFNHFYFLLIYLLCNMFTKQIFTMAQHTCAWPFLIHQQEFIMRHFNESCWCSMSRYILNDLWFFSISSILLYVAEKVSFLLLFLIIMFLKKRLNTHRKLFKTLFACFNTND